MSRQENVSRNLVGGHGHDRLHNISSRPGAGLNADTSTDLAAMTQILEDDNAD